MSSVIATIIQTGIQNAVLAAEKHLTTENRDDLLGTILSKFTKEGTGKTIFEIACYGDAMRVIFDTLLADGKITSKEVELSKDFLVIVATKFGKIRKQYADFVPILKTDILPFLKHYRKDNAAFGYKNDSTLWSAVKASANIAKKTGDETAYKVLCKALLESAKSLLMIDGLDQKEKEYFIRLGKELNSIKMEGNEVAEKILISEGTLQMVQEDFESMNQSMRLMEWLQENHWRLSSWMQAALGDDPKGQVLVGLCNLLGIGGERNDLEAAKWFKKSASQGNLHGQLYFAQCLLDGNGIQENKKEAVKLIRKIADQGNPLGQLKLGRCYEHGLGVPKDPMEGVKFYRMAAEQGHPFGQSYLGLLLFEGKHVKQDKQEAAKWFLKSAEQECESAQFQLGSMYKNGEGVPQDIGQALYWLEKSAAVGNSDAQVELGKLYQYSLGPNKNPDMAFKWFHQAATRDDLLASTEAMFLLGICYLGGLGVSKNKNEGMKWIRKSAEDLWEPAEDFLTKIGTNADDFDLKDIDKDELEDALSKWMPNEDMDSLDTFAEEHALPESDLEDSSFDLELPKNGDLEPDGSSFDLESPEDRADEIEMDETNVQDGYESDHETQEQASDNDDSLNDERRLENACRSGDITEIIRLRNEGAKMISDYQAWKKFEAASCDNFEINPYSRQVTFDDCPLAVPLKNVLKVVGPIYGGPSFSMGDRGPGWARAAAENRIFSISDQGYGMVGDQIVDVYSRYITTRPIPVPWNTLLIGSTDELDKAQDFSEIPEALTRPAWARYSMVGENIQDQEILEVAQEMVTSRQKAGLTKEFAKTHETMEIVFDYFFEKPELQENNLVLLLKFLFRPSSDPERMLYHEAQENGIGLKESIIWKFIFWRVEFVYAEELDPKEGKKWLRDFEKTDFQSHGKNCKVFCDFAKHFTKVLLGTEQPTLTFIKGIYNAMDSSKASLEMILFFMIAPKYFDILIDTIDEEEKIDSIIEVLPLGYQIPDGLFNSIFLHLVDNSDVGSLKKLLDMGFCPKGRFDEFHFVPVSSLVNKLIHTEENEPGRAKKMEMLKLLLDKGANPYETSHFGMNAIGLAHQEGTVGGKSVQKLLEKYRALPIGFPGLLEVPTY